MAKSKLTAVQKERIAQVAAETGNRIFDYGYQGAGVLRSLERYLKTGDSSKITKSAYNFLMMRCGFIAHFDHHNFQIVYSDVREFLSEFKGWNPTGEIRRAPSSVYSDGMTDVEVLERLFTIVDTYAPEALHRAACR